MPHFKSNIPSAMFYGSIFSEFLLEHFLPKASELYSRMLSQGANQSCINKQILKGFKKHLDLLKNYGENYSKLLQKLKLSLSRSNYHFLFIRF